MPLPLLFPPPLRQGLYKAPFEAFMQKTINCLWKKDHKKYADVPKAMYALCR